MQPNNPNEQKTENKPDQILIPPPQGNIPAQPTTNEPEAIQVQQPATFEPQTVQPQQASTSSEQQTIQPQVQPSNNQNQTQPNIVPDAASTLANNNFTNSNNNKKLSSKKIGIIALVLVLVLIGGIVAIQLGGKAVNVVTTGSLSGGISLTDYDSQDFNFSMKVPEGWTPEVKNEEYYQVVSFQEPIVDISDTSEENTNYAFLSVEQSDYTDKEFSQTEEAKYFENIKKALQSGFIDQDTNSTDRKIATLESEETTVINGHKALKVKLKVTNFNYEEGEVGYEYSTYVFVDEAKQYNIFLSAHESEKSILAKADEIIDSFSTN